MPDPHALPQNDPTPTDQHRTDQHRTDRHQTDPATGIPRRDRLRALLWTLLVLSVAANTITSFGVVPLAVSIGLGLVTGATAITLVSLYVRNR